jgi:transcriptional regulator with XRE-family HTH domain
MKQNNLRIKEILKEKRETINFLAEKMEISRVTLSNMISRNPTLKSLENIARHLEVPFTDLFKIPDKEPFYFNGDFYCTKNDNVIIIGSISNSFLTVEFSSLRTGYGVKLEQEELEKFIYSETYKIDPFPRAIISSGSIEHELFLFNTFKKNVSPFTYRFITENIENFFLLYKNNKGKEINIKVIPPKELDFLIPE